MTIDQIRALTKEAKQKKVEQTMAASHEEQDKLRYLYRIERELIEGYIEEAAKKGESYKEVVVRQHLLGYLSQHFSSLGYEVEVDETSDGQDVLRLKW